MRLPSSWREQKQSCNSEDSKLEPQFAYSSPFGKRMVQCSSGNLPSESQYIKGSQLHPPTRLIFPPGLVQRPKDGITDFGNINRLGHPLLSCTIFTGMPTVPAFFHLVCLVPSSIALFFDCSKPQTHTYLHICMRMGGSD